MAVDKQATQALLAAIAARRTVAYNKLKTDPVSDEHLNQILEAANQAPTHKYTEPWRFAIFRGAGRRQLADLLSRTYKQTAAEKFLPKKYAKAQTRPLAVPCILAVMMCRGQAPKLPEYEEVLAVGCAVQNLMLAAHALGLGCGWSTPAYVDHANIRAFFELGPNDRCFGFLYLGYRAQECPPTPRRPLADKLRFIED